jgi:hypothetical protein
VEKSSTKNVGLFCNFLKIAQNKQSPYGRIFAQSNHPERKIGSYLISHPIMTSADSNLNRVQVKVIAKTILLRAKILESI